MTRSARSKSVARGTLVHDQAVPANAWAVCVADGTILSCSPSFRRLTGRELPSLLGQSIWRLAEESDGDLTRRTLLSDPSLLENGLPLRIADAAGGWKRFWCMRAATEGDFLVLGLENNSPPGASRNDLQRELAALRRAMKRKDAAIAEMKLLLAKRHEDMERRLREYEERVRELEHQRATWSHAAGLDHLAARIVHEINNPLAGVKNALLLIDDAISPDHPYYAYLGKAQSEINRMSMIVRHVHGLFRAHEEPRKLRLLNIVREVSALLEPKFRDHAVALNSDEAGLDIEVTVEQNALRQILYSLVVNAIEASAPGGEVCVRCERTNSGLFLQVADQGHGIPEQAKARIFEAFFTTKARKGGLGLGLSAAQASAKAIGGSIAFAENLPHGTVFTLWVPQPAGMATDEPFEKRGDAQGIEREPHRETGPHGTPTD